MEVKSEAKLIKLPVLKKCRCCLEIGDLKDMWAEYYDGAESENYGEMLSDCFAILLEPPTEYIEQICSQCIMKLRDAYSFKQNFLSAQKILAEQFTNGEPLIQYPDEDLKEEYITYDLKSQFEDHESKEVVEQINREEGAEVVEYYVQDDSMENCDQIQSKGQLNEEGNELVNEEELDKDNEGAEYFVVEYLEEDEKIETDGPISGAMKRKWPKKKKRGEIKKYYRNYTDEDLRNAMEAVNTNKMTRKEASDFYNIPVKTLGAKLRAEATKSEAATDPTSDEEAKEQKQKQHMKLIEEIKLILLYTNATPYRSRGGRFYCAYCLDNTKMMDDPNDLRAHTRTEHFGDRIKNIKDFMKPQWMNEVVKIDIENLLCTVCYVRIPSWNYMFEHLKEVHHAEFDEAYSKVIPFKLSHNFLCALCDKKFDHYHMLDGHMNSHFANYICGACGDTFLSETRLKKHSETHNVGRHPCPYCNKVFPLEKYMRKHVYGVHSLEERFKCNYCSEKFKVEYSRHLHVIEKHKEKVKTISCDICDKTFTWKPYYLKHMRFKHGQKNRKFKCKRCSKSFAMKHELKNHEEWHTGQRTVCSICGKKFSTKQYLQKHIKTHANETIVII